MLGVDTAQRRNSIAASFGVAEEGLPQPLLFAKGFDRVVFRCAVKSLKLTKGGDDMERVIGIDGVFLKAQGAGRLRTWYRNYLH